jgi:hypothetical protein
MRYEVLDATGRCIVAYECRDVALEAFLRMADDDSRIAEDGKILEIDEENVAVGCIDIDPEILAFRE